MQKLHFNVPSFPYTLLRAGTAVTLGIALSAAGCKPANPAPQDDATLTNAVQNKLLADTSLGSEPIESSVQQGIATLNGPVSSAAARSLAASDVAQVPGIKTVVNNLTVQPTTAAAPPSAAAPPAATGRQKLSQREKPSASIHQSQHAPPPPPQEAFAQQPAPISRPAPPAAMPHTTPPILPVAAFRSITLPTDSTLSVRIDNPLDSATAQSGDTFTGTIASDVVSDGLVVLAQGTRVNGRVDTVQEAGHFKGNSLLTISLVSIDRKGESLGVSTDEYSKAGDGRGKNSAEKIGGGAAVGAILGGILGGGKGAAIGAGVGGGAGAGVQAATRGQQVQIPAESLVRFHLTGPLTVRVSTADRAHPDPNPDSVLRQRDQ